MSKAHPREKKAGTESARASKWAGVAEALLYDEEGQPANNASDRPLRRKTTHNINEMTVEARALIRRIEREIDQDGSELEQQRADNEDRVKRREADEAVQEREADREDIRVMVEIEERRRAMRQRDVILVVTAFTAIATIVMAFVTVWRREPWPLGVTAATSVLWGGGLYLLRSLSGARREVDEFEEKGVRAS